MMNERYGRLSLKFIIYHSVVVFFLLVGMLPAQVVRLPAVTPEEHSPPGRLVSHPDSSSDILQSPGEGDVAPAEPLPDQPRLPPGVRDGVFQKALFDYTWLAPIGPNGLGFNDLLLQSIFALPCPTRDSPLVITPGFGVNYLQGPQAAELPPQLYQGYVQFRWLSQVTPTLGLDLSLTPGVFSDFQQEQGDAFRMPGHAAAAWTWTEKAKVVLGAAYLARPDVEVIPIGGVIWTPNDETKFDLVFPHPKISRRMYFNEEREEVQDWVYIAGEFAGDAWAVRLDNGIDDQVVLSDYRLIFGLERKVLGGISSRVEVGYVFGRRIRYSSGLPEFRPSDTVMLRGGLSY